MSREPSSALAGWPTKDSKAAEVVQAEPPGAPSAGGTELSAAAQLPRSNGANSIHLGIDLFFPLFADHPAHLELAIFDREGKPAFD